MYSMKIVAFHARSLILKSCLKGLLLLFMPQIFLETGVLTVKTEVLE